ncbi:discoidin domain-containing protein [Sphingobacterium sp. JUb56]|uniref:discoidin domain-containing protein n=1 Tax=Sphingobacterium sp. JUb56 TaxID=2587145 RepID=UPI001615E875|nr:discoidin domain-containing protein [Sphingobacterium sp. JUb56]
MKRKFNLNMSRVLLFGGLLLAISACKEEELIFPPQVGQGTEVTEKRPTARPSNLTYVSAFNKNVEIYWPELSDRVVKAQIKYTDAGTEKVLDVTKFDTPVIIPLSEVKAYEFALQYFTADGTPSKVTKTELSPRPYEADFKMSSLLVNPVAGGVTFIFPKTSERAIPGTISYVLDGKQMKQAFNANIMDTVRIQNLSDETKIIDFTVNLNDEVWNRNLTSQNQTAPGLLVYKAILPTLNYSYDANNVVLNWVNNTGDPIDVTYTFDIAGDIKTANVIGSTAAAGSLKLDVAGRGGVMKATVASEGGISTEQIFDIYAPIDRSAWSAEVSSIETNEGAANGKASSLIDGDINTYWHSTWSSGSFNYPHWFVVNLGKEEMLSKIGMIRRHNNTTGGFKTFNIEVSLNGTSWTMVSQNLTFNSEVATATWQDFVITPVNARYVRITMTAPYRVGATSTHLAEFRAYRK